MLETWDDAARWLRERRTAAANPAYAELARRVRDLRVTRDGAAAAAPGRMTVYDCFRDGRRRMDLSLLVDLATVLGTEADELVRWERACFSVQNRLDAARIVSVSEQHPRTPHFVGRDQHLAAVQQDPRHLWLITGMPGVGKTQFALHAAQSLIHQGTARRLLVAHLRGFHPHQPPADGEAMLDELIRVLTGSLASRLDSHQSRQALLAEALARDEVVLLLDDAASVTQVRAIVGEQPCVAPVICTSRVRLDLPEARPVRLEALDPEDSLGLLTSVVSAARVAEDAEAAHQIIEHTSGHPLALDLVARQVNARAWPLADHAQVLATRAMRLHVPESVEQLLVLSVRNLSASADLLLRELASVPCPDLADDAVAALHGPDAAEALAELERANLVQRAADRVSLHDLVRAFAMRRSEEHDPPSARTAMAHRLLEHYLVRVRQALTSIGPGVLPRVSPDSFTPLDGGPEPEDARRWLTAERANLVLLTDTASAQALPGFVSSLGAALCNWFDAAGWFSDAALVQRRALDQAEHRGDGRGAAEAGGLLGAVLVRLGDPAAEEVLASALDHPDIDPYAKVNALTSLAVLRNGQGDLEQALDCCVRALALVESGEVVRPRANLIGNIGVVHVRLGHLAEGAHHHRRAHEAAMAEGDLVMAAVSLANLSPLLLDTDPAAALDAARRAVDLSGQQGATLVLPNALTNAGVALTREGDHAGAVRSHREALDLAREIEDPYMTADILNNLAESHEAAGDVDSARTCAREALDLATGLSDPYTTGRAEELLARTAPSD